MAKFFLFAVLLCALPFLSTPISASNGVGFPENEALKSEECNAPAPDSFRVASVGGDFISMTWKPAWVGATHMLTVSEKDAVGGWTPVISFPNVPGSSFRVDNLDGGKEYRFRIATKCPSGDPSELTAFFDDHTVIVELTLAGRTPKDPKSVECTGIQYLSHNWIGFMVAGESASNIFEVQVNENPIGPDDPIAFVRRVVRDNPIVAVNSDGFYPNVFTPIIKQVFVPFRIVRISANNGQQDIGEIELTVNSTVPPTIDICVNPSIQYPWKSDYLLTTLTAKSTIISPTGGSGQGFGKHPTSSDFEIQNPFNEYIRVLVPLEYVNIGKASFQLMNTSGQVVLSQTFDFLDSEVLLSVGTIVPGIYILQIETELGFQAVKLIKPE